MLTTHTEQALIPYQQAFGQMAIGAIVVREALARATTDDIRGRLALRSFVPFRLVHRGHFAHLDDIDEPELVAGATDLAELITETKLSLVGQRCYRLTEGDYVLSAEGVARHGRAFAGSRLLDVIVDLSEHSSGEAQVVYAHKGEHFFAAPQLSRSICVVERRESVTRYHRYLNHKMEGRTVYRHCLTFAREPT